MTKTRDKLITAGFYKFFGYYLEQLISRKLVALYDNYEDAKKDILFEITNKMPEQSEGILRAIELIEKQTDILEHWETIGTKTKKTN